MQRRAHDGPDRLTDSLVQAAAAGDRLAQEQLLDTLRGRVGAMLSARLAPHHAHRDIIDDLVQETLLSLSLRITALNQRTVQGLRSYLSVVVRNRVFKHLKDATSRPWPAAPRSLQDPGIEAASSGVQLFESIRGTEPTPSSNAARAEIFRRLTAAMADLRPAYREVLTLAFFDQLNSSQIAEVLEVKRTTAAMLVMRALEALRRHWRIREQAGCRESSQS